ncbi:hypothetical protein J1N35_023087 [Gossypium stocksii]|uniref:Rapid ALkalinization Factor n=1 Tax=Gossypium stocksii TaxID=47602 RepID=A0A9D3VHN9_9ROSI|nr:hypothetical protein J1N35_023086 [Gossypium stocksii]KAH1083326.1 hypothetical protein J1N35_023087 [Gossypium stocksii]
MGVEKKMMVVWICAMVVSSMLMENGANAENLKYGAIERGDMPKPCRPGTLNCVPEPANKYYRGCSRLEKCRNGR